ncbi:hypothetical protein [Aeromicrobium sp.]|uniref:hypothetical protein n=1 Tax=Aeromicrobium sp. TaxID=1871063 RepID=UPI00199ED27C|nr:hypothetical protein [Aeromicrobium sp.]MBC7633829.1 hypothetical protein [Aeromicrobium sp.]
MARPMIVQTDAQMGFHWADLTGQPITLSALAANDDEPDRLLPTHLEALDDTLIQAAGAYGEILGGGRAPADRAEEKGLRSLHRAIDRLCHEYADALTSLGLVTEVRGGQIIGTAALMSIWARQALGLLGPAPLEGQLDEPDLGVISGFGDIQTVDVDRPWLGGRWIVRTETGRRLPATLSMLMFDSSGVNKDASLKEHRELLISTTVGSDSPDADRVAASCAIDWLLYDWLMAHRDGPDSGAVEVPGGVQDATMIVSAAAASARARAVIDPGLIDLPVA